MDSQEAAFKKLFDMEWHEPTVKDSCLYLPRRRQAYLEYLDVWLAALLYASQQGSKRDKAVQHQIDLVVANCPKGTEIATSELIEANAFRRILEIWNEAKNEQQTD
jgi:hypothetical protein